MILNNEKISSPQIRDTVIGIINGSFLIVAFASTVGKQNTWLAVTAAIVPGLFLMWVYLKLALRFSRKDLIESTTRSAANTSASFFLLSTSVFFFIVIISNLRFLGVFINIYLLPETPMLVILILFTLICARRQAKASRLLSDGFYLQLINFINYVSTFLLLINEMELANLLPILDLSLKDFLHQLISSSLTVR